MMMFVADNLPVLQVIIPLLAAAFCAIFRSSNGAWVIATAATWGSFAVVIALVMQVLGESEPLHLALGGHEPPMGIAYRIDILNSFVMLVIGAIAAVMMPYAKASIARELPEKQHHLFYCMYLLCLAGMFGILSTNDIFNIYVFIEISSLSTYTLIALGRDRQSLVASFEYLVLGTVGATFLLIGVGLLYMMTGTLNISDMAARLPEVADTRPVAAAFAFISLGLMMKIAMFPVHIWLVNSYTYAPSFVSAFVSATATKVMVYLFIRFIYTLFTPDYVFGRLPLGDILLTLSIIGIFLGSLTAIYQHNIKRLLAFSSLAQLGYMMLGVGLDSNMALTGSMVHIANHALAKGALFMAVGAVVYRCGGAYIKHFYGMGRHMPWTMAAFVLAGLSLIGVPGTAGFISKWYLWQACVQGGYWWLLALLVVSSLLAVVYIWKVVEVAYFRPVSKDHAQVREVPLMLLVPLWVLTLANVWFGINTDYSLALAQAAADMLLGGAP